MSIDLPTDESIKKLENAEKKRIVAPKKKKSAKHRITKSLTHELLCLAGALAEQSAARLNNRLKFAYS